jgi:hypothetical protein
MNSEYDRKSCKSAERKGPRASSWPAVDEIFGYSLKMIFREEWESFGRRGPRG